MKNILINPKIYVDKRRNEINDVIDHRLISWLLSNSYNPIIISNKIFVRFKTSAKTWFENFQ